MDGDIISRIGSSGRRLNVTKTDIAQELVRLAGQKDAAGLQALFTAYCQWEHKQAPDEDPDTQRSRCLDNFYVVAQIGDCIVSANGDAIRGFMMYEDNPDVLGETTQFFSDTYQYTPPLPEQSDQGIGPGQ
jgi:hypothetical protein